MKSWQAWSIFGLVSLALFTLNIQSISLTLSANLDSQFAAVVATQPKVNTLVQSSYQFKRVLKLGSTGADVKQLQIFLNQNSATLVAKTGVGSKGKESTYYGPATLNAVDRFQLKYKTEILTPYKLTKPTGTVGVATLKELNSLLAISKAPVLTTAVKTNSSITICPNGFLIVNNCRSVATTTVPQIASNSSSGGSGGSGSSAVTTSGGGGNSGGSVSGGGGNTPSSDDVLPGPIGTPGAPGAILVPGSGFTTATSSQPATVGSGPGSDAEAIARWDVVPYQTFNGNFNVGVIAFHINGIDHVAFSANNGEWTNISQMTLNSQSGVAEYWATLRASDYSDGPVEVRAIAYPKVGVPRVLGDLTFFADAGNSLQQQVLWVSTTGSDSTGDGSQSKPFSSITKAVQNTTDGATIYLQAGSYDFISPNPLVQTNNSRWIVIAGAPGVDQTQVLVQPKQQMLGVSRLELYNLTVNEADGSGYELTGCYFCNSHHPTDELWIENSVITSTLGRDHTPEIGQPIDNLAWQDVYLTNSHFHDYPGRALVGFDFVRNVDVNHIADDACDNPGLLVNVTINDVVAGNEGDHIDAIQWFTGGGDDDSIVYNVKATNVAGQLLFGGAISPDEGGNGDVIRNVAVVNYLAYANGPAGGGGSQVGPGSHLLYYNITMPEQIFYLIDDPRNENIKMADSIVAQLSADDPTHEILEHVHLVHPEIGGGGPTGGPNFGTITRGDPLFVNSLLNSDGSYNGVDPDLHLTANSPLRGVVTNILAPVDVDGIPRVAPDSVGAYSQPYVPHTPVITLTAFPLAVTSGNTTTLTWTATDSTSCTASGGWSGSKNSTSGNETTPALTTTTTFTLSCSGIGGSASVSTTVTIGSIGPSHVFSFDGNANDSVGNQNGTLLSGSTTPTYVTGHAGQALSFDGTNGVSTPTFSVPNAQTIAMWIYPTFSNENNAFSPMVTGITGTGNNAITSALYFVYGSLRFYVPTVGFYSGTAVLPVNQWSHVVMVNNNGAMTFYVNGAVDQGSYYGSTPPFTSISGIGNSNPVGTNGFVGYIDDVKIYNQALATNQVSSLYQTGAIARADGSNFLASVGSLVGSIVSVLSSIFVH